MKNKISRAALFVVGVVFLISATAKAWGANSFASLVMQYGISWFAAFVPVLIAVETVLGIMLLLNLYPRWSAVFSMALVLFVTLFYVYGLVAQGITDCGCFGSLHVLNSRPWLTFLRNALLVVLCVVGFIYCGKGVRNVKLWKAGVVVLLTAANTFVCGLDMGQSFQLPVAFPSADADFPTPEKYGITKHLALSKDSSYAVYLFSYTCPFCQNNFANVEQYQKFHQVDKVYGLVVEDSVARLRFERIYKPEIEIVEVTDDEMSEMVSELPIFIIVKGGKIVHEEVGSVVSPGIFME